MSPRIGPYGQLEILKAEVNRLINLLLENPSEGEHGWQPPVDVIDGPKDLQIQIELPGLSASDVKVVFTEQRLTVSGIKRRLATEPRGEKFHLMERFIGSFQVSVEIVQPVDPGRARATLERGILTVVLPRVDDRRHRSFEIPIHEETRNDV